MSLHHLFDAELHYRAEMPPVAATGEGEPIGSGDGTVRGENVEGTIRWTLFERPGELVCAMNPTLVIETTDGAEIRIEGRGYARRESRGDRRWKVAATLLFKTPDERYAWLDGALGVWEGEFDAETHRARYRAYAPLDGTASQELASSAAGSFTRSDDWRARRDRLESNQRALYREILLAFARGEPPTRESLAAVAAALDVALPAALARYEELDLALTDAATGDVAVAYFFASEETASEYVDAHPDLTGAIAGIPAALAGGRAIFEEALR
ncbi:MAG: DUF3237 family protein [Gaiellaceae bacterium]